LHFVKTEPVPSALIQYAEIAVTPATGAVVVTTFIIGVDCGKIINPRQLDRCMKSGVVMGLSEALKEEVTFDTAKVTSTDWNAYRSRRWKRCPRSGSSRFRAMARGLAPAEKPRMRLVRPLSPPRSSMQLEYTLEGFP
jgi:CO/xanthine dehydrogenase Mo-binding subunit